jgi:hypothetical protein
MNRCAQGREHCSRLGNAAENAGIAVSSPRVTSPTANSAPAERRDSLTNTGQNDCETPRRQRNRGGLDQPDVPIPPTSGEGQRRRRLGRIGRSVRTAYLSLVTPGGAAAGGCKQCRSGGFRVRCTQPAGNPEGDAWHLVSRLASANHAEQDKGPFSNPSSTAGQCSRRH